MQRNIIYFINKLVCVDSNFENEIIITMSTLLVNCSYFHESSKLMWRDMTDNNNFMIYEHNTRKSGFVFVRMART